MDSASAILESGHRIYLAATGAGAGIQERLWNIAGISKVLIGAEFPYAKEALDRFLGFAPDSYCSADTAIEMAMASYTRAFADPSIPSVGLGLTASVASTAAHRGDHRVYVATVSERGCFVYTAILEKGAGSDARRRDGMDADALAIRALLDAVGCRDEADVVPHDRQECAARAMKIFLDRGYITPTGARREPPVNGNGLALFPGAFHPPHDGHFWMAERNHATFHITIDPPHKPALSVTDVLRRATWLRGFSRLFTAGDPLYIDKARRFPGAKIVIGVDALERMLDPKWGVARPALIEELRSLGIRLLVADREVDGTLQTLSDLPDAPLALCERVLGPGAHLAMSSTKVRAAMGMG